MVHMLDFAWPGKWAGEVYSGPKPYIIMKIDGRQFLGMPNGILELQYFLDPHMARSWPSSGRKSGPERFIMPLGAI